MDIIDLTGQKIGYWTVLEQAGVNTAHSTLWRCRCKCRNEKTVVGIVLRDGRSRSCGCLKMETLIARNTKHGHATGSVSPTYQTWSDMIRRCREPSRKDYPRYGGRGITVCNQWQEFSNFLSDMGERPEGLTIDRIDTNGNYEPKNCRWATRAEQVHKISYAKWQESKSKTKRPYAKKPRNRP